VTDHPRAVPSAAVTGLRLHGSLDLAEIADIALDAAVPGLADAASVFALDRLLRGAEPRKASPSDSVTVRRLGTCIGFESEQAAQKIFPVGAVIVMAADSPYARCFRGAPLVFAEPGTAGLNPSGHGSEEIMARCSSVLAVPAVSKGQFYGFVAFARTAGSAPFSDADTKLATELAAGVGAGIANSVAMQRQRSIADTLQRALVTAAPGVPPGIEAAARCFPAQGQVVGGDWYDLLELPGGRSGIIVGDVMGHGPEAGAMMAHLRSAAHGIALTDPEPAELLRHLDQTAGLLSDPVLATCLYAVIDPAGRSCTLATAGHLPPVLAGPDGTTRVPDLHPGQSLGLGLGSYGQARVAFAPGTVLALYTDGLVETRTRSFDEGILALRAALSRQDGHLEMACDTVIAELAQLHEDDVTLVLARCP